MSSVSKKLLDTYNSLGYIYFTPYSLIFLKRQL